MSRKHFTHWVVFQAVFLVLFEAETMYLRLALNSWLSFCLSFPSAVMTGIHRYTCLMLLTVDDACLCWPYLGISAACSP